MNIAKAISKFDPEVVKATEAKFMNDMSAGAPLNWYPNYWLCFLFLGRPAPVDKRCLVVSASHSEDASDALEMLGAISNKTNRRSIAELNASRRRQAFGEVDSTEDSSDSGRQLFPFTPMSQKTSSTSDSSQSSSSTKVVTSPPRRPRQLEVTLKRQVVDLTDNDIITPDDLISKYDQTIDSLYKQSKFNPSDLSILSEIQEIERKRGKILKLQLLQMEEKLGYSNI